MFITECVNVFQRNMYIGIVHLSRLRNGRIPEYRIKDWIVSQLRRDRCELLLLTCFLSWKHYHLDWGSCMRCSGKGGVGCDTSILAHRGCGSILIDWLDKAAEAGFNKGVTTGRYAF